MNWRHLFGLTATFDAATLCVFTEDIDNILVPGFTTIRADRDSDKAQKSGWWFVHVCQWQLGDTVLRAWTSVYPWLWAADRVIPPLSIYHVNFVKSLPFLFTFLSVDQPVFNSCDLSPHLPTLQQYITCPTRLNITIDLCYGTMDSAYRPACRRSSGRSDRNVFQLLPKYKQKVKTEGTQTQSCQLWTDSW